MYSHWMYEVNERHFSFNWTTRKITNENVDNATKRNDLKKAEYSPIINKISLQPISWYVL